MSMRSQVYEWSNLQTSANQLRRLSTDQPVQVTANREYDIFTGGIGNNITKPAETTATQFIVIEDIACKPNPKLVLSKSESTQLTTSRTLMLPIWIGIPGLASPYPRGAPSSSLDLNGQLLRAALADTDNILKSFDLYPDVYVLPGQTFQILYTTTVESTNAQQFCRNFN